MRWKLFASTAAVLIAAAVLGACSMSTVLYGLIGAPPPPPTATAPTSTPVVPTAIVITVMVTPLPATPTPPPPTFCAVRQDWFNYIVQPGDTLARIAARSNTTAAILAGANCLANMNIITVGQVLKVPVLLVATSTPTHTPTVPGRIPRLEQGGTTPDGYINADSGNFRLRAGSVVNVTWHDAPGGLQSATFYTTSMDGTRQNIGTDLNPSDGVTMQWTVPYGLNGHQLRAEGPGFGAASFDFAVSFASYVYSDNANQCYVEILADQPLFERPDPATAVVGTAPMNTVWPVIANATGGWVGIELNLGWLPISASARLYGSNCPF